jgi:ferric-dicitrate binding protein FerR (iron transport regulator)
MEELRRLARSLPYREMSPDRIRAVRAQVLMAARSARQPAKHRRAYAVAAAVLMIALGLASVLFVRKPAEEELIANVVSMSGQRPRRVFTIEEGVRREIVTLASGRMAIEVKKLSAGERFVVVTDDAEVEVRGTRFQVEAKDGILEEVTVEEGVVEVRPRNRPIAFLAAGQRWQREAPIEEVKADATATEEEIAKEEIAPPPPPEKKIAKKKEKPIPKRAEPSAREPTDAERAFQEGWRAYREGRSKEAAALFDRVLDLAPGTPLAEDAAYWKERALVGDGPSSRFGK